MTTKPRVPAATGGRASASRPSLLDHQTPGEAGPPGVGARSPDGLLVQVVAKDGRQRPQALFAAVPRLLDHLQPRRAVERPPTQEAEVLAHKPGSHVGGHPSPLYQQSPRAAHRVYERAVRRRPRGANRPEQDGGRQVLFERGFAALEAIPAAMQTVSREVEADDRLGGGQMYVDADVGPCEVYAGPGADALSKAVDHRILYPLFGKVRVQAGERTLAYG